MGAGSSCGCLRNLKGRECVFRRIRSPPGHPAPGGKGVGRGARQRAKDNAKKTHMSGSYAGSGLMVVAHREGGGAPAGRGP